MKDNGGPAFACAADEGYQPGMSLRDYFAASVSFSYEEDLPPTHEKLVAFMGRDIPGVEDQEGRVKYYADVEAKIRGIKADAMLAERSKE
jgi:hypothetical protein